MRPTRTAGIIGTCSTILLSSMAGFAPGEAQQPAAEAGRSGDAAANRVDARRTLVAAPLAGATVTLDGRLDEAVWGTAVAADAFIVHEPEFGASASQRTEARVVYGDDAIYIGMRLYDTSPDSIVGQLARRDQTVHSDWAYVGIDSYHDRRTAFIFGVNPRGVKVDLMIYDDVRENISWDAIWDVATSVDSLGWTAEFRIPLSQLRFGAETSGDGRVWGVQFQRKIARSQEVSFWAPVPRDANGLVSLFGDLRGLRGLQPRRNLEVLPYTVAQVTRAPGDAGNPFHRRNDPGLSAGADIRYSVTTDLTLNATINPDFGQVEADPSVVNLSAFETFLPEKRPFFVEGGNIFNFGVGVGDGDMGNESLFYSRRIGRAPQGGVPGSAAFHDTPSATTILGAAKLSGRTAGGWSVGLLNAVTAPEHASWVDGAGVEDRTMVEPWTNYAVARVMRDFDDGTRSLGAIGTATNRKLDGELPFLRSAAYAGGLNGRQRFGDWELTGWVVGSHIRGDTAAIARAQRSPARYFQRADNSHVSYDPTRTSLSGWAASAQMFKTGGGHWRAAGIVNVRSPGFEVNDLGYQQSADQALQVIYVGYDQFRPTTRFRRWGIHMNQWTGTNFGGDLIALGGNINGNFSLPNFWGGYAGINREQQVLDVAGLRGGPAITRPGSWNLNGGFNSDSRQPLRASLNGGFSREDDTGATTRRVSTSVTWRASDNAEVSIAPSFSRNDRSAQYLRRLNVDGDAVYLLGGLEQTTTAVTARVNYTASPSLSLQLYAQPFISAGRFNSFMEATDPRADRFADRYTTWSEAQLSFDGDAGVYRVDRNNDGTTDLTFGNPDFNFKQMRTNAVVRWEYRPGSALFVVWGHGRTAEDEFGDYQIRRDVSDLWSATGTNTLLIKFSYWLGL
ncbi:MAG TPA: DUF5916 domain-containing protein [Longimicrobiales bacterium]|nr:DUF5916 domain-containing protein [Longimicrobiales bacterium]